MTYLTYPTASSKSSTSPDSLSSIKVTALLTIESLTLFYKRSLTVSTLTKAS